MGLIDSGSKSNRLLASRRYTHNTFTTAQESFTNVLDLRAEEIYTQASKIPSSDLPFSGSSQNGSIHTNGDDNILKYYYRKKLTKSNINNEVWFFLNPTGSDSGIDSQLIDDNQQTNFISPKYSVVSLTNANTEDNTPGYGVKVFKSTSLNSGSLGSDDIVSTNDYQFDYKTGVLQFLNSSVDPSDSQYVYMTAYQYVGTTLATRLELDGGVSGSATSTGSFGRIEATSLSGDGSSLTNVFEGTTPSSSISTRLTNLSSDSASFSTRITVAETELEETIVSASAQLAEEISGSFSAPSASFSTRITNLKSDSGSFSTRISNLNTDSGSFSTRITADSSSFSTRTTDLESKVGQSLNTTDSPVFDGLRVTGDIHAERYIVSSSVSIITSSFSSGSTIFGDTMDDTHTFTGSLKVTGSVTALNLTADSSSFSTRVTNLKTDSGSFSTRITADSSSFSTRTTDLENASASFSTRVTTAEVELENTIISASAQLSEEISGSFTAPSASFSTRITNLVSDSASFSTRITVAETELEETIVSASAQLSEEISGSFTAPSASFSTRITNLVSDSASFSTRITTAEVELENTIFSASAQLAEEISGSFSAPSASFSTRITNLVSDSSSFSTRITVAETELENTIFSASAQLAEEISGSFTAPSASFSTRITNDSASFSTRITVAEGELENTLLSASAQLAEEISGSFSAPSASFSTRITNLVSDSASFSTRITTAEDELENTLLSASAQLAEEISGSFSAPSASFSTRITNLKTDSGSFSSRTTTLEGTGTVQGVGTTNDVLFNSITGSASALFEGGLLRLGKPGPSSGVDGKIILHNNTGTATFTLHNQDGNGRFGVSSDNNRTLTFDNEGSGDMSIAVQGNVTADGNISGSVTSTGSFGNLRVVGMSVPDVTVFSSSLSTRITADSSSFSTRVTRNEGTGSKILNGQLEFTNITASGNISGSATSTGSFGDVMVANNLALGGDPIYNTGTTGANLTITANNPYINLNDSNSTSGTRVFSIGSDNNKLKFAKMTDDGGTKVEQFLMNGNGNFSMGAGAGNLVEHTNSTGGNLTLDGNNPALNLYDNNASSGARNKAILSMGGAFYIGKTADDGTSAVHHIVIDDSGNVEVPVGNISGSSTSTGSFGELEVDSNIQIGSATLFSNSDDLRFNKNFGININPDSNLNGTFLHIYDGANAHLKLEVAGPYNTGMHLNNSTAMTTFYNTYANATNYGGFRWNAGGGEGADGGGTELMRLRGSRLGILNANPPKTLTVGGDISGSGDLEIDGDSLFDGNITGSGHISMSLSSTGSLGRLETTTIGGHSPLIIDAKLTQSADVKFDNKVFINNIFTSSVDSQLDLQGKIFVHTGSIVGDLHIKTNENLMRFGKSTSGLIVSASENISRFVTGSDGSIIDLGFTIIDEDGNTVLAGDGDGIHVDSNNYWYNNKFYKIGDGVDKFLSYDNVDLKYKGEVYAKTGSIDGELYIQSPTGSMFIGKYTGGLPSSGSGTISRFATGSDGSIIDLGFTTQDDDGNQVLLSTGDGIHLNGENYWYTTGHFKLGDANNFINWDTSNLTISGTFSGDGSGLTYTALEVVGDISGSAQSTGSFGSLKVDGASIDFSNVPTSDPNIAGRVWRDGTDLKISTG